MNVEGKFLLATSGADQAEIEQANLVIAEEDWFGKLVGYAAWFCPTAWAGQDCVSKIFREPARIQAL